MYPGFQSEESRLVQRLWLNEYLRPVSILLIQNLHVDLALLQVYVVLLEVLSNDIFDLSELLRKLVVNFYSLLMQLVGDILNELLQVGDLLRHRFVHGGFPLCYFYRDFLPLFLNQTRLLRYLLH